MPDKKYELRKQVKSVRWIIFWVVLAQFAAEISIEAAVSFMSNPPHRYLRIAIVELLAIGVPVIIYLRPFKETKKELCLEKCAGGYLFLSALLGILGQFAMMILNVPANYIMTTFFDAEVSDAIPIASQWHEVLGGVFSLVLIPAILEEIWMRGIIFRAYSRCSTKAAVIFTTIVFALLHFRANEVLGFLLMGITASIIMIKSGSLYAAIVYHAFSNLTALLFGGFIMPYIIDGIWWFFLGMVVLFLLALFVLLKQKNKIRQSHTFRTGTLLITSIFSLPVILSAVVVCIKFFLLKVAG